MTTVDLNCDLGEGAGSDAELMPLITSANIACGAHAGDSGSMRAAVEMASRHRVAVGAHPGFDDRAHFGRRELPVTGIETVELVLRQVRALQAVAKSLGTPLAHVKPHGGLYNLAARDRRIADAVALAVWKADPDLILFGLAGSQLLAAGRARGLRVASEAFADRAYRVDGFLVPRGREGAVLEDASAVAAQGVSLVCQGRARAVEGGDVPIAADTLCLHGDGAGAVAFALRLRAGLAAAGVGFRAVEPRSAG